jgi:hypothetical protein
MLPLILAKNLNLCLRFWQRFTDLFLTVVMVMDLVMKMEMEDLLMLDDQC